MTFLPTPETALTIACCRWPRSPERDAAVRGAAAAVNDWAAFESLLTRHRVVPLAHDGLAGAGVALPGPVGERLRARAERCAVTALTMARESVRLQQAFDAAGIPALILKGAAVGVLAYGDPCLKESWDIDLLTTLDAVSEAGALLGKLGYDLTAPEGVTRDGLNHFTRFGIEAGFHNRENGLTVELHWRLNRNRLLLPAADARSPSQAVRVAGSELRTFEDDILFAYLCVHGAYHAWARLKWLADLNAFIADRLEAVERLVDAADRLGAGRAARGSLLLCRRLFGTPVVPDLALRMESDRSARFLQSVALRHIQDRAEPGDAQGLLYPDIAISHLFLAPGGRFLWEQLHRTWEEPLAHSRYGFAANLLRIPLWLGRLARRLAVRWQAHWRSRRASD